MKIFVTGACGQIGSHLIDLLLARSDTVIGIDNLATGFRGNLPETHPNLELTIDTISDKEIVNSLVEKHRPDAIVHTAASYKDPEDWYNDTLTNCVGGANLINAAKEYSIGRFIYFQTALCYGLKPETNPITLAHPKNPANSSYAISKTTTEAYLEISDLDWVSFRLANVVGSRNVSGPLPIFYERLMEGKKCFVTPARRDFVFGKDLVKVVVQALDGKGSGAYHFSSGIDIAIKTLYDAVFAATGLEEYSEPDVKPLGEDEAASILLDPSKTLADFTNVTFTPLEGIVADAAKYYREHGVQGGYTHLKMPD